MSRDGGRLRVVSSDLSGDEPSAASKGARSRLLILNETGVRMRTIGTAPLFDNGRFIGDPEWLGNLAIVAAYGAHPTTFVVDLSHTAPKVLGDLGSVGFPLVRLPGDRLFGTVTPRSAQLPRDTVVHAFGVPGRTAPGKAAVNIGYVGLQTDDHRAVTYLADTRTVILPVTVVLRAPRELCTEPRNDAKVRARLDASGAAPEPYHLRCPRMDRRSSIAFIVDKNGGLREIGRYVSDRDVLRMLPIGGRLVAVTHSSLMLLRATDLQPLAYLATAGKQPARAMPH
jgi:hypothetical protein